jgi:hypothetical protein
MAKVYRVTDRIKVQIDDVTFEISPLTVMQKADIKGLVKRQGGEVVSGGDQMVREAIRQSVKSVSGLVCVNGEPYVLAFKDGVLTDEAVDDLSNIPSVSEKLVVTVGAHVGDTMAAITDAQKKIATAKSEFLDEMKSVKDKHQRIKLEAEWDKAVIDKYEGIQVFF